MGERNLKHRGPAVSDSDEISLVVLPSERSVSAGKPQSVTFPREERQPHGPASWPGRLEQVERSDSREQDLPLEQHHTQKARDEVYVTTSRIEDPLAGIGVSNDQAKAHSAQAPGHDERTQQRNCQEDRKHPVEREQREESETPDSSGREDPSSPSQTSVGDEGQPMAAARLLETNEGRPDRGCSREVSSLATPEDRAAPVVFEAVPMVGSVARGAVDSVSSTGLLRTNRAPESGDLVDHRFHGNMKAAPIKIAPNEEDVGECISDRQRDPLGSPGLAVSGGSGRKSFERPFNDTSGL